MENHRYSKKIQNLRQAFNLFDQNNSGVISINDLGFAIKSLGQKTTITELQDMLNNVDLDYDGSVTFDEFLAMMSSIEQKNNHQFQKIQNNENENEKINIESLETMEDAEIRAAFEVFDQDQDGFISKYELAQTMIKLGEDLTNQDIDEMMKEADKDGFGRVSFEQFKTMILGYNIL